MQAREVDVLIVGAGLSGIGAAYHLQTQCPGKTYAIVEARGSLGGTWDLFRYPGIRSDSDMYTLGYSFRPWTERKAIADGPSILRYLHETAEAYGIDRKIQYHRRVEAMRYSSADKRWTVNVRDTENDEVVPYRCQFVMVCAGYYDYDGGHAPDFVGKERFGGQWVHPQHWPEDLDYDGKRVVIIGSGATAVTLLPNMAKRAAHVTMLQRSPTYILSAPATDVAAQWLQSKLSPETAYAVTRAKNIAISMALYAYCRSFPEKARAFIEEHARRSLKGKVDVNPHFSPRYEPWDQRLCLAPDGDFFKALRNGSASVVTDQIESVTETGLRLQSGEELEADILITATGLKMKFLGGASVEVDGRPVELGGTFVYRGLMLSDVPNAAFVVGYTNASWTLKADLASEYFCRVINHMDAKGYAEFCPRASGELSPAPLLDLSAGYVQRAAEGLPKQGTSGPWKLRQNYAADRLSFQRARLEDGHLQFA